MFKRIPIDKTRGMALALALLIAGSAGVAAAELTFDLRIEGGQLPDAMQLIRVTEGDIVKLRWTSDRPIVLHLHGYNIEKRVVPGTVTELAFTADATGRFPVHIHEQGAGVGAHAHEDLPLAIIEVYPR
jgi:hypothetical protein